MDGAAQNRPHGQQAPRPCRRVPPARPVATLADDARAGLLERPRWLPPKYFYDERGSYLFDRICDTAEYYPTRTEARLLADHANEIIERSWPRHLLELGSGASRKTAFLFDACDRVGWRLSYWPFDVCEEILLDSAARLTGAYPWLAVEPLLGDYHGGLDHLPALDGAVLWAFLGGTLGNFPEDEAARFLSDLRRRLDADDRLLLGVDRVKSRTVLEAAYNDAEGVTAAFNLNLLNVLNRELDADFEVDAFAHEAVYNEARQRIEMRLVAQRPQRVRLAALDAEIELEAGERILTEISRKFTPVGLEALAANAGLEIERHFEPDNAYFSLALLKPA